MVDYVEQIKTEIAAVRRAHRDTISSLHRAKYETELHILEFLTLPLIEALQAERDALRDKQTFLDDGDEPTQRVNPSPFREE